MLIGYCYYYYDMKLEFMEGVKYMFFYWVELFFFLEC